MATFHQGEKMSYKKLHVSLEPILRLQRIEELITYAWIVLNRTFMHELKKMYAWIAQAT